MSVTAVTFHSEGFRLVGDLYAPEGLKPGERRAGIVLCHGYTGVKDLYLPDNARVLVQAGYVVLAFDYKGWGEERGPAHPARPVQPGRGRPGRTHLPGSTGRGWMKPGSASTERVTAGRRWCGPARSTGGSGAS